jgi:hypothetical protein
MKTSKLIVVLVLALVVLTGCSKAPVMEENNATQAMSAAEQGQSAKYAAAEWKMAQDTLQAAISEKQTQDERFALFRSYGKSKALFEKSAELASAAQSKAAEELARVRRETEIILGETRSALDSLAAQLLTVPVGKDTKAEIELMKQDVAAFQQQLNEAQGDFQRANYDGARGKATAIMDKVTGMKSTLDAAVARTGGRRKA